MLSGPRKFSIARRVGREKFSCKKSFEPGPPLAINNDRSLSFEWETARSAWWAVTGHDHLFTLGVIPYAVAYCQACFDL